MLVRLFKKHSLPAGAATAWKTIGRDMESTQMCQKITYDIKKMFDFWLLILSVEKVKTVSYWKKGDDDICDNIRTFKRTTVHDNGKKRNQWVVLFFESKAQFRVNTVFWRTETSMALLKKGDVEQQLTSFVTPRSHLCCSVSLTKSYQTESCPAVIFNYANCHFKKSEAKRFCDVSSPIALSGENVNQ